MTVEHINIQVGKYVLTEDVTNPKADRRVKRDWRQEVLWQKGTKFIVEEHHDSWTHDGKLHEIRYKTIHRAGKYRHQNLPLRKHREADDFDCLKAEALSAKLEFVPTKSLGEILNGRDGPGSHNAAELLAICLERGLLTIEQVESVVKSFNDMSEDDFYKLGKTHEIHNA